MGFETKEKGRGRERADGGCGIGLGGVCGGLLGRCGIKFVITIIQVSIGIEMK